VVGRLSHEKGVDLLLHACARLSAKGMRFHLNVVGDGPDKQALMDQCRDLGLGARTTFVGHVTDTDAIYSTSDLLVIPSRSEGLPNVLLEAMRFGLPSAATSVGAVPEVLSDPLAGVLCAPDDIDGLTTAITTALASGYFERGLHARTEVLHRFSLSARCLTLRKVYDELLSNEFLEEDEGEGMPASSGESIE
jgi:glycosyltransferase involved in cell wall biosynthesis